MVVGIRIGFPVFAEQRGLACDHPQCSAKTKTSFMAFLSLYFNV